MNVLVTGSSGLIGSESVTHFDQLGCRVTGVDAPRNASFFGPRDDATSSRRRLERTCRHFRPIDLDIRNRESIDVFIAEEPFDLVIHAAAEASHDPAGARPFEDRDSNAVGTLNLLEAFRKHRPEAVFIHVSTSMVYGDGPNHLEIVERETRYDFADPSYARGIDEHFPLDQSMHTLFGASRRTADQLAQEYGRYFGMKTGIFRAGCMTGPGHPDVEPHGFLNDLVAAALREESYTIHGYRGKQVRDVIHCGDVVRAFQAFAGDPHPGEVFNIGGGRENAASVLECIELIAEASGRRPAVSHDDTHRIGNHICYYTDHSKLRTHYPDWRITRLLPSIIDEMVSVHAVAPVAV